MLPFVLLGIGIAAILLDDEKPASAPPEEKPPKKKAEEKPAEEKPGE